MTEATVQQSATTTREQIWLNREQVRKEKPVYRALKRVQDVFFSLLALIVLSPLMLIVALAIVIDDPKGSPIFTQVRSGIDGKEFRISKTHFADRYSGGESMMQLAQRIYNLLDELKADTGKTYLLVAHNGIARVVESYFHDMTNEEYSAAGIKNCELVEYRFE